MRAPGRWAPRGKALEVVLALLIAPLALAWGYAGEEARKERRARTEHHFLRAVGSRSHRGERLADSRDEMLTGAALLAGGALALVLVGAVWGRDRIIRYFAFRAWLRDPAPRAPGVRAFAHGRVEPLADRPHAWQRWYRERKTWKRPLTGSGPGPWWTLCADPGGDAPDFFLRDAQGRRTRVRSTLDLVHDEAGLEEHEEAAPGQGGGPAERLSYRTLRPGATVLVAGRAWVDAEGPTLEPDPKHGLWMTSGDLAVARRVLWDDLYAVSLRGLLLWASTAGAMLLGLLLA